MNKAIAEFVIWLNRQVALGKIDDWKYDEKEDKIIVYQNSTPKVNETE